MRAENLTTQQIDISDELVKMFHSDQSFSEMSRTVKGIRINKKNGIENTKVKNVMKTKVIFVSESHCKIRGKRL